ncbi:MAG: M1 family metallopeptidase [Rhodothermales bacterium]|nr:M1 family metallopeptidase [Rhodothermales bacterium]
MSASLIQLLFLLAALLSTPNADVDPRIDVERYTFHLELFDGSDSIKGQATVEVLFREAGVRSFSLDLVGRQIGGAGMAVESVLINGADAKYTHDDDRLSITMGDPSSVGDRRTVHVVYSGRPGDGLIISTNKYGERTFFGDNWPDRARHWLPVVDHPSDKALIEFIVTAPDRYQVVGSGALVEETDLKDGRRLTHWRSTKPLATKVAVIGAARFAVSHVDVFEGVPIQTWVYPQDKEAGFYDYALAEPVLRFFVSRLGRFPYSKLANVQSKTRYGGMENASNIFYSEASVTGTRSSEELIAHEIAHQWFGDSVTEIDWPHIWLSEGFATYLTALYVEHTYGHDRFADLMSRNRETVVAFSRRVQLPVILDPAPGNLLELLSPNSYQKGGWVLHMLRSQVGTEVFWDGLRTYYERYSDGNASTEDFQNVMEDVSGLDLEWFFEQWLKRPGQPAFEGAWSVDASSGELRVELSQVQDGQTFKVPVEFGIYSSTSMDPIIVSAEVDERSESFSFSLDFNRIVDVRMDPHTRLLMHADFGPR